MQEEHKKRMPMIREWASLVEEQHKVKREELKVKEVGDHVYGYV